MQQQPNQPQAITEQLSETLRHVRKGKNTRSWCKGRPGRKHKLAIVLPPNLDGFRSDRYPCGWRSRHHWRVPLEPLWFYICNHVEMCTTCGKVFRRNFWGWQAGRSTLGMEECPNFTPQPTGAPTRDQAHP